MASFQLSTPGVHHRMSAPSPTTSTVIAAPSQRLSFTLARPPLRAAQARSSSAILPAFIHCATNSSRDRRHHHRHVERHRERVDLLNALVFSQLLDEDEVDADDGHDDHDQERRQGRGAGPAEQAASHGPPSRVSPLTGSVPRRHRQQRQRTPQRHRHRDGTRHRRLPQQSRVTPGEGISYTGTAALGSSTLLAAQLR